METEVKEVFGVFASYTNWKGTVEEWRRAFFTLLSHKNSFSGFYELTIDSTWDSGAYLYMVCDKKELNQDAVTDLLTDLGYEFDVVEAKARVLYPAWNEEWDDDFEDDIQYYFVD